MRVFGSLHRNNMAARPSRRPGAGEDPDTDTNVRHGDEVQKRRVKRKRSRVIRIQPILSHIAVPSSLAHPSQSSPMKSNPQPQKPIPIIPRRVPPDPPHPLRHHLLQRSPLPPPCPPDPPIDPTRHRHHLQRPPQLPHMPRPHNHPIPLPQRAMKSHPPVRQRGAIDPRIGRDVVPLVQRGEECGFAVQGAVHVAAHVLGAETAFHHTIMRLLDHAVVGFRGTELGRSFGEKAAGDG